MTRRKLPLLLCIVALAVACAIVGFAQAATNLGATSTDKKVGLVGWERSLMFCTFLIMLAIEISLFIDKPGARVFAVSILAIGLILRGLVAEAGKKKDLAAAVGTTPTQATNGLSPEQAFTPNSHAVAGPLGRVRIMPAAAPRCERSIRAAHRLVGPSLRASASAAACRSAAVAWARTHSSSRNASARFPSGASARARR